LQRYLDRKIHERGWDGAELPDISGLVERVLELGYIDDAEYARMKARDLSQRGYGGRRIAQALYQAGIRTDDPAARAAQLNEDDARKAAERYARKKRIGRYGSGPSDRATRERQLRAMLRAGHQIELAKFYVEQEPDNLNGDYSMP